MARQAVLTREPDPLDLAVIFDESTLHRAVGNAEVMATQLDHLVDLAERPNVELRVLPYEAGMFPIGSFWLFTQPGAVGPYMAVTEDRAGPHYLDAQYRPHEVEVHGTLYEYLARIALSPSDTLDKLTSTAKEYHQ